MTKISSRKKFGFQLKNIQPKREQHPASLLSQRSSFWIATLSMLAFVFGNMVGQHGWYLFWASVMGAQDESAIVYTGTLSPIAQLPDYDQWRRYGGDHHVHNFRQAPESVLIDLPHYSQSAQRSIRNASSTSVYSVGYLGSYRTGAEESGNHPGVDIRVPVGTPVRTVMNGIVSQYKNDRGGFGLTIVIKHPNVPDPSDSSKTTTLYSSYAHLSSVHVSVGQVVNKGQQIGLSGNTGNTTGPHLHFQIDTEDAPWHPYWPFTGSEARAAGMTFTQAVDRSLNQSEARKYTIHPMLYVQSNFAPVTQGTAVAHRAASSQSSQRSTTRSRTVARTTPRTVRSSSSSSVRRVTVQEQPLRPTTTVASRTTSRTSSGPRLSPRLRFTAERADRLAQRRARRRSRATQTVTVAAVPDRTDVIIQSRTEVAAGDVTSSLESQSVARVDISHDGNFSGRGWESVRLRLLDKNGNKVTRPDLSSDLYLKTAYGDADFRPSKLRAGHFVQGETTVHMLPRGRRTVVIEVQPLRSQSRPMVYVRSR